MELNITPEIISKWFGELLRVEPQLSDTVVEFDFTELAQRSRIETQDATKNRESNFIRSISLREMHNLMELLRKKEEHQLTGIYDKLSYEVLVAEETPYFQAGRLRGENFILEDHENGIKFTLSKPSDHYMIYLLYKISQIASIKLMSYLPSRMIIDRLVRENNNKNVLDAIKLLSPRFLTLQVSSNKPITTAKLIDYANSFFFQLSYNLDIAIVPQKSFDELIRTGRIERVRRSSLEELIPPSRFYNSDLVHYYQEGVASDSPPLQYLSYYHVAEHFFERIYNDELIERVKKTITQPDFSYKRKKDISELIKKIRKWVNVRDETMTFNEQEALVLTLQNFIDLSILTQKIQEYDDKLIEYYRLNSVGFSGGEEIDLEDSDSSAVLSQLAKRIYKTRNAIVHSKENEKGKYIPFEHEKILTKEVPLVRFIAELIIIGSSEIIQ